MTNESIQPTLFDSESGLPENTPKIVPPSKEFDLAHPDTPVDTEKSKARDPNERNITNYEKNNDIGGGIGLALAGEIGRIITITPVQVTRPIPETSVEVRGSSAKRVGTIGSRARKQ